MLNLYPLYAVSIAVFVSFRFLGIFKFFMPSSFLCQRRKQKQESSWRRGNWIFHTRIWDSAVAYEELKPQQNS